VQELKADGQGALLLRLGLSLVSQRRQIGERPANGTVRCCGAAAVVPPPLQCCCSRDSFGS
jgi:hypothetical protein